MAESPKQPSQSERADRLAERFGMTRADIEHLLTNTNAEYSSGNPAPSAPAPAALSTATVSKPKPLGAGSLAIIFAILLVGLMIAFSLKEGYFPQRPDRIAASENRAHAKPADTAKTDDQSAPPFQPTTVPPGELPPEAQVTIPHSVTHGVTNSTKPASVRPALQTSSEFEAEERLAELRADGNTKARIKSVRKHGTVSYQVFGK
jgi:hypothetical protein